MSTVSLTPPKQHIAAAPGVCGGKPCIAGTRIRVWDIAACAQAGLSPDEILGEFPSLTLADVHAALAYYYDNLAQIDADADEDRRFAESLRNSTGPGPLEEKLGVPRSAESSHSE